MKVLICYNDHEDTSLHKTIRITLPKHWSATTVTTASTTTTNDDNQKESTGTTSTTTPPTVHDLLIQFLKSYNQYFLKNKNYVLNENNVHLAMRRVVIHDTVENEPNEQPKQQQQQQHEQAREQDKDNNDNIDSNNNNSNNNSKMCRIPSFLSKTKVSSSLNCTSTSAITQTTTMPTTTTLPTRTRTTTTYITRVSTVQYDALEDTASLGTYITDRCTYYVRHNNNTNINTNMNTAATSTAADTEQLETTTSTTPEQNKSSATTIVEPKRRRSVSLVLVEPEKAEKKSTQQQQLPVTRTKSYRLGGLSFPRNFSTIVAGSTQPRPTMISMRRHKSSIPTVTTATRNTTTTATTLQSVPETSRSSSDKMSNNEKMEHVPDSQVIIPEEDHKWNIVVDLKKKEFQYEDKEEEDEDPYGSVQPCYSDGVYIFGKKTRTGTPSARYKVTKQQQKQHQQKSKKKNKNTINININTNTNHNIVEENHQITTTGTSSTNLITTDNTNQMNQTTDNTNQTTTNTNEANDNTNEAPDNTNETTTTTNQITTGSSQTDNTNQTADTDQTTTTTTTTTTGITTSTNVLVEKKTKMNRWMIPKFQNNKVNHHNHNKKDTSSTKSKNLFFLRSKSLVPQEIPPYNRRKKDITEKNQQQEGKEKQNEVDVVNNNSIIKNSSSGIKVDIKSDMNTNDNDDCLDEGDEEVEVHTISTANTGVRSVTKMSTSSSSPPHKMEPRKQQQQQPKSGCMPMTSTTLTSVPFVNPETGSVITSTSSKHRSSIKDRIRNTIIESNQTLKLIMNNNTECVVTQPCTQKVPVLATTMEETSDLRDVNIQSTKDTDDDDGVEVMTIASELVDASNHQLNGYGVSGMGSCCDMIPSTTTSDSSQVVVIDMEVPPTPTPVQLLTKETKEVVHVEETTMESSFPFVKVITNNTNISSKSKDTTTSTGTTPFPNVEVQVVPNNLLFPPSTTLPPTSLTPCSFPAVQSHNVIAFQATASAIGGGGPIEAAAAAVETTTGEIEERDDIQPNDKKGVAVNTEVVDVVDMESSSTSSTIRSKKERENISINEYGVELIHRNTTLDSGSNDSVQKTPLVWDSLKKGTPSSIPLSSSQILRNSNSSRRHRRNDSSIPTMMVGKTIDVQHDRDAPPPPSSSRPEDAIITDVMQEKDLLDSNEIMKIKTDLSSKGIVLDSSLFDTMILDTKQELLQSKRYIPKDEQYNIMQEKVLTLLQTSFQQVFTTMQQQGQQQAHSQQLQESVGHDQSSNADETKALNLSNIATTSTITVVSPSVDVNADSLIETIGVDEPMGKQEETIVDVVTLEAGSEDLQQSTPPLTTQLLGNNLVVSSHDTTTAHSGGIKSYFQSIFTTPKFESPSSFIPNWGNCPPSPTIVRTSSKTSTPTVVDSFIPALCNCGH